VVGGNARLCQNVAVTRTEGQHESVSADRAILGIRAAEGDSD
jgi:hypothetical protein